MRNILVLGITVSLLLFGGLWEINYMNRTSQYLLADSNHIKNYILSDNIKAATVHVNSLEDTWESMNSVWDMISDRDDIDEIEIAIDELRNYIISGNKEEALVSADVLKRYVRQVVEKKEIILDNIM
ncbi:MAG: DUF4363 family protein [Clostridia bacterium]